MPRREIPIVKGEVYHLYNRSVNNEKIFIKKEDIFSELSRIKYYKYLKNIRFSFQLDIKSSIFQNKLNNSEELVEIYSFAIMPNHFHFLAKEIKEHGITIFMRNLQNSYAKYYNNKNKRNGALFQGRFKVKHIVSTEQLIHVVRYVHLNPVIAHMFEFSKLSESEGTSYKEYLGLSKYKIVNTGFVLRNFASINEFKKFHENQVDYQRRLSFIKKLSID